MLTKEDVALALPANLKSSATQQLTDTINTISADPTVAEHVREHFVTFSNVLTEGKWSAAQYVDAIHYVTYKLMGNTNLDAYTKTFPQRYQQLVANGTSSKDISAYVTAYNKGKLVNLIMEKALIPVHVLYNDVFHKAIMHQAHLMLNAQSEKVQSDAANSIMTHLAKPKEAAPTVAIQINNNAEMDAMKQQLSDLADMQLNVIEAGVTVKEVAATKMFGAPKFEEGEA